MSERMYTGKTFTDGRLRGFEIVRGLKIEPVLWRLVESATEQQRQFRRHRMRLFEDPAR